MRIGEIGRIFTAGGIQDGEGTNQGRYGSVGKDIVFHSPLLFNDLTLCVVFNAVTDDNELAVAPLFGNG